MTRLLSWLFSSHRAAEVTSRFVVDEDDDAPVRIDRARMQDALASETYAVNPGLSREQKRQLILAAAERQR